MAYSSMAQCLEQHLALLVSTILFSLLPILILLLKRRRRRLGSKKQKLVPFPPSPPKLPIIGNLHQLGNLPYRSLRDLSQKHGPLMLLHMGQTPALVVSSAQAAKEVLKINELNFMNRPALSAVKNLFYDSRDMGFAPYSDNWRMLRKICMTHLLSSIRVQTFRSVREEEVALMIENVSRCCDHPSEGLINLSQVLPSLTHDILCRVAMGGKYSGEHGGRKFTELAKEFMKLLSGFHVGDLFPSLRWVDVVIGTDGREKRFSKEMDGFLEQVIQDHLKPSNMNKEESEKHKDFVDVLLKLQKDDSLNFPFTKETIKAIILDIYVAGQDTTAMTPEWAMTELARNPLVMKKAQDEVRRVAAGKTRVEESDLHQLEYLKAIVKETLRLHPAAPLLPPRESINDIQINGYLVPAKSTILTNFWAIGRDPQLWDSPEEFQPERFLNCSLDYKGQDFQYIPFGSGRRGCPGPSFAIPIVELALANLLFKFDWELPNGMKPEDIDMTEELAIAVRKATPLVLAATPHLS